ncbi:hypothetical protein [Hyphomicrobium sp. CS1GBMeth3]|uniref:hypothetical protein n=1 Tax=Hyphomicrobium sp. CS1GBMeth3 TaxID=1892845 RepID=UPI000930311C|nr:hypothetical protein [Hyphomicrobium sp. CS1GBMeth3]
MLDTRSVSDTVLRCDALLDRVAATPIGPNAHGLRVMLAECDAIERALVEPAAVCRLRDVRHWLRLAYDRSLHGYPPERLRESLLGALAALGKMSRA